MNQISDLYDPNQEEMAYATKQAIEEYEERCRTIFMEAPVSATGLAVN